MDIQTEIGSRLRSERKRLGLSRVELGTIGGVSEKTQGTYERGERWPDAAYLTSVRDAGVDLTYVLAEVTERAEAGRRAKRPRPGLSLHGFSLIPMYDIKVSAGGGTFNHDATVLQQLAFRTDWITTHLELDPDVLAVVEATGDSMMPTINPRDTLLVDRSAHRLEDGLYVLAIDDRALVKRVQVLADGSVRLTSDNPVYTSEDIRDQELEQLTVVGRVVWIGRRV